MIVVDANAVLYALLPRPMTDAARAWLGKYPDLFGTAPLFDEVRNVLTGHVRRRTITAGEAASLCAGIRARVTAVEMADDAFLVWVGIDSWRSDWRM